MKNAKSCANCEHACRVSHALQCRKKPPRIVDVRTGPAGSLGYLEPQILTAYPVVQSDWWCGDFFPEAEAPQLLGAVAPEPGREN